MIVDSHIHCGVQNVDLSYEVIAPLLQEAGIDKACMFAPVEDVYDRADPGFYDSPWWQQTRARANSYLLEVAATTGRVFPYFFVWNDFAGAQLGEGYFGVKWHRHDYEPRYDYQHPRCREIIALISERRLPVVLEESFVNTCRFAFELAPEVVLIIPHLGLLNGSYDSLEAAGIWRRPHTYADTALAAPATMHRFLDRYGPERLLFGSDFPFGSPRRELDKVAELQLPPADFALVAGGNILRLLADTR